jgi:hypothetical protein
MLFDIVYLYNEDYVTRTVTPEELDDLTITCAKIWYVHNNDFKYTVHCDSHGYMHFRITGTPFEFIYHPDKKKGYCMRVMKHVATKSISYSKEDFDKLISIHFDGNKVGVSQLSELPKWIADSLILLIKLKHHHK